MLILTLGEAIVCAAAVVNVVWIRVLVPKPPRVADVALTPTWRMLITVPAAGLN